MTEAELKSYEHETDITNTCRAIIKRIFPHPIDRAAMLISKMDTDQLKAVQSKFIRSLSFVLISVLLGYARMVHSAQAKVPNSILNNAIGNVFASDKRNVERKQLEKGRSSRANNETDDEEEFEGLH